MTISPILPGRLPGTLLADRLQQNLQHTNQILTRLQDQAATGQRYFLPSESPGAAIRAIALQRTIERKEQMQVNVATDRSFLNASESTLATVADSLTAAKAFLLAGVGDTTSDAERLGMAAEVTSMVKGVVNAANTKFRGRYLYGGTESSSLPFHLIGGGFVKYSGNSDQTNSLIDFDFQLSNNIDGVTAFNALTNPAGSDVDPALTLDTKISDLNGGLGVKLNSIMVTIDNGGPVTQTVDLSTAETIRDIKTRLENAFSPGDLTVDIPPPPNANGIRLTPVAGTVEVTDIPGSTTARDLGIASTAVATIVGQDIDPQLTLQTPLSAFNAGNGVNLAAGLNITNGLIQNTVDVSSATNVEELFNLLEAANLELDLQINSAANGLAISSRLSGANFSIGENNGTTATDLGIRTLDGSTLLADLNYGIGVPVNLTDSTGMLLPAEISIVRRDGTTTSVVDLKGLTTVQDVINAITAVDANITASLNAVGNGISIVDTSGTGPLEVLTGDVADALGLTGIESGMVNTVPLVGKDVNLQLSQGAISLLVQLETALRVGDDRALERLDSQFDAEIQRLNLVRGEIGSRLKTLDETENRLLDQELLFQENLSEEFDADLSEVISQVANVSNVLQATLQIASSTLNLSLLSFL
ncbi:MAG: hypothetical protein Tsb009_26020 [Planctomycetaceae bacterium]